MIKNYLLPTFTYLNLLVTGLIFFESIIFFGDSKSISFIIFPVVAYFSIRSLYGYFYGDKFLYKRKKHFFVFQYIFCTTLILAFHYYICYKNKSNFWRLSENVFGGSYSFATIMFVFSICLLFFGSFFSKSRSFFLPFFNFPEIPSLLKSIFLLFCTYVYVTLFFSAIYSFIEFLFDKPFSEHIDTFVDSFYFSAITITTLGYGDIYPKIALSKFIVSIEALLGIFFIAAILSTAISLAIKKT